MDTSVLKAFKTLGLEVDAANHEIRQSYRRLVKIWHPDLVQNDVRLREEAQERFMAINEAYRALRGRCTPLTYRNTLGRLESIDSPQTQWHHLYTEFPWIHPHQIRVPRHDRKRSSRLSHLSWWLALISMALCAMVVADQYIQDYLVIFGF